MSVSPLEMEVWTVAGSCVGEKEKTSNSSPFIDQCLAYVNCKPGLAWCAAAVSWIVNASSMRVPCTPKFKKSAGAMRLLERNPELIVSSDEARELLKAGHVLVFVMDHGGGLGHTGFACGLLDGDKICTREGNTGPGANVPKKDRNGDGFYERTDRDFTDINGGWIKIA
jgi:hypothetical protein